MQFITILLTLYRFLYYKSHHKITWYAIVLIEYLNLQTHSPTSLYNGVTICVLLIEYFDYMSQHEHNLFKNHVRTLEH